MGNGEAGGAVPEEAVSLSLYVQSPVAGPKTDTIDRLTALDTDGAIASFDVQTVPEEMLVSQRPDQEPTGLPGNLDDIVEWHAPDIRPTFGIEEVRTRLGRTVRRLSPPETALAVYVEQELGCVFPCTNGTRVWTVADFLDSYETSREPPARIDVDLQQA